MHFYCFVHWYDERGGGVGFWIKGWGGVGVGWETGGGGGVGGGGGDGVGDGGEKEEEEGLNKLWLKYDLWWDSEITQPRFHEVCHSMCFIYNITLKLLYLVFDDNTKFQ